MHYIVLVAVVDRVHHLEENFADVILGEGLANIAEVRTEILLHHVHDDANVVLVFEEILDLDDRRMVQSLQYDILKVRGLPALCGHVFLLKDLDGNILVREELDGLHDLGLSSFCNFTHHVVPILKNCHRIEV